jgi:hypothetical protein
MNTDLEHRSEEYHALANRLLEAGHVSSAEFYEEVAQRVDAALAIQELTDERRRAA